MSSTESPIQPHRSHRNLARAYNICRYCCFPPMFGILISTPQFDSCNTHANKICNDSCNVKRISVIWTRASKKKKRAEDYIRAQNTEHASHYWSSMSNQLLKFITQPNCHCFLCCSTTSYLHRDCERSKPSKVVLVFQCISKSTQ